VCCSHSKLCRFTSGLGRGTVGRRVAARVVRQSFLPEMESAYGTADTSIDGPREGAVQQAVQFLSDGRVQAADPERAAAFLRTKKLTENEIQEAFRRARATFPDSGLSLSSRPGRSWTSIFWGIAVAVGALAAARELLSRYVVPVYFPEIAAQMDGRRRREPAEIGTSNLSSCVAIFRNFVCSSAKTCLLVSDYSPCLTDCAWGGKMLYGLPCANLCKVCVTRTSVLNGYLSR
jgi:Pex14 N-terminal domain